MTYKEILSELHTVGLAEQMESEINDKLSAWLLSEVKTTTKINSTASLIRMLLRHIENDSPKWLYWEKAFHYFLLPEFKKNPETLKHELENMSTLQS